MSGEPAFFEIGVEDLGRARTFYGGLFGWTFGPGADPDGEPGVIEGAGMPGGMHGGDPKASPYLFFRVEEMETALKCVRELGGEVEEMDIEGGEDVVARFGRFKLCRDDQGSPFGLHQPPRGG